MSENSSKPPKKATLGAASPRRRMMLAAAGALWVVLASVISMYITGLLVAAFVAVGVPFDRWIEEGNLAVRVILSNLYVPLALYLIYIVFKPYLTRLNVTIRQLIGAGRRVGLRDIALAVPAYVVYYLLIYAVILSLVVSGLLSQEDLMAVQDLGLTAPGVWYEYVLMFILLVVLPPIIEEVLFRGYLYGTLRQGFAPVIAALVTSLLFGAAHGQLNVFIDTFVLSLVLCYLREKTGAIWAGMALHALKNLVAFTALYILHLG